jgi:hypothetical protein
MLIISHKQHHDKIVQLWERVLEQSLSKHRLTLFYVANCVVQFTKRKKLEVLYEAFKNRIANVIPMLRDNGILKNVQRVLTVWTQREVFDEDFIQALNNSLDKQKLKVSSPEGIQQIKEESSTLDANGDQKAVSKIEQQEKTAAALTSSLKAKGGSHD